MTESETVNGVVVDGCFDCPFAYDSVDCVIDDGVNRLLGHNSSNVPDWCPLRRGPMTVSLAEGA